MPTAETDTPAQSDRGQETRGAEPKIDLHALAQKVYELLKREARIECERTGQRRP
jgi:hypothetical protein